MNCKYCNPRRFRVWDAQERFWITGDAIACPMCGESLKEPEPLTLERLRSMDGEPVWLDGKCYIVNTDYKSPQGWSDECGVDLWGNGTSLSILARCGCCAHKPTRRGGE